MPITLSTRQLNSLSDTVLAAIAPTQEASEHELTWYDDAGAGFALKGHAVKLGERVVMWTSCAEAGVADIEIYRPGETYEGDGQTLVRDFVEGVALSLGSLRPPFPVCTEAEHAWKRADWGLEENPGVQGHGGGVLIEDICTHCALSRTTDTWADDGRGGHCERITYTEQVP